MDEYTRANRRRWDALAEVHPHAPFYDVAGFRAGGLSLRPLEREEVGSVEGKTLLHLQCHFGLDTLSWARLGARVTGVDFSERAIARAEALRDEAGLEATFLCADVYDLPDLLGGTFDVVFTSYGVLCWLPDVPRWARVVARYVRPGGFFYLAEDHPFAQVFDNEPDTRDLRVAYPYFPREEPLRFEAGGSYADVAPEGGLPSYEWPHGLGEVVTALREAGLRLAFLHESPSCSWQRFPFLVQDDEGWWRLPPGWVEVPLTLSLKATRPRASGRP